MSYIEDARRLRPIIEQATASLDDKTASEAAVLFPVLKGDGSLVRAGTRISHNGVIKKAAVDLWDTAENSPGNAPTLWEELRYKDGYIIIPDIITATTAFAKGTCGWWGDKLYRSLFDGNIHNPDQYPNGWEVVM